MFPRSSKKENAGVKAYDEDLDSIQASSNVYYQYIPSKNDYRDTRNEIVEKEELSCYAMRTYDNIVCNQQEQNDKIDSVQLMFPHLILKEEETIINEMSSICIETCYEDSSLSSTSMIEFYEVIIGYLFHQENVHQRKLKSKRRKLCKKV